MKIVFFFFFKENVPRLVVISTYEIDYGDAAAAAR